MNKFIFILAIALLTSCTTATLAPFSGQSWHVDAYTGKAVSDRGMELAFGSEWMICDTTLIQSAEQLSAYPKLEKHLAKGIAEFPEIIVDSIYFYNPARGLLFASYHHIRPLKPNSEIYLYNDTDQVYSKEYARIFGQMTTAIDDDGWEDGPQNSVYTNTRYRPDKKQLVLLHRIPYHGSCLAIFQVCHSKSKHWNWNQGYPPGTLWNIDLGDPDNLMIITAFIQAARTTAVSNLHPIQKTI